MTLKTRIYLVSTTVGLAAIAGAAGLAVFASAAATEVPTITATVQDSTNTNIASALVGATVHANVTVASSTASTSPTGTVDFNLYSNQSCTGSPLTQTGVGLVNGQASSSGTTLGVNGLSYTAHYSGQGDLYAPGNSNCASISASSTSQASTTAISLTLSNNNIQVGSSVFGIPNLTGETNTAGGTLQYNVYSNNTCTNLALNAGSQTVTNGVTPNSANWQFITPGTYWWQVTYSGDSNNLAATSSCGTVLTVNPTTITQATPTLSTQLSNSSVQTGSSVYDTATLSNASSSGASGTVSYKVYTDNACTAGMMNAGTKTVSDSSVPQSNSLIFNTPGTYYWQAMYSGDANDTSATSSCQSEVLTVSSGTTTPPTGGPGTISGTVFNDLNKNDMQNSGEPGLAGWTIWLHEASSTSTPWWKKLLGGYNDPIVATAVTDSNGNYSFGNLGNGQYFVEENVMSGWDQTSSDTKVTLDATHTSSTINFANIQLNATSTNHGNGHGDGDNDNDDQGSTTATSSPGNSFFGHFHWTFPWFNSGNGQNKNK